MKHGWKIWQIDLLITFLYRFLDEIIYVEQPHLFEYNSKLVCRLKNSLYRLKQALQVSYQTLADFLGKIGLEWLKLDHDVFVLQDCQIFFAIFVNNLRFFVLDDFCLKDIQDKPNVQLKMTNLR